MSPSELTKDTIIGQMTLSDGDSTCIVLESVDWQTGRHHYKTSL